VTVTVDKAGGKVETLMVLRELEVDCGDGTAEDGEGGFEFCGVGDGG